MLMTVFLRLGWWQWSKGMDVETQVALRDQRSAVNPLLLGAEAVNAQEVDGIAVVVRGHFDVTQQFFLDNQQHEGRPGVHVITPLQIEGSQVRVLVNRGWIGWGGSRTVLHKHLCLPVAWRCMVAHHCPQAKLQRLCLSQWVTLVRCVRAFAWMKFKLHKTIRCSLS